MSWKGMSKAISRLPHQVMASKSKGEVTKDQEFADLERRLAEVQGHADSLLADAQAFRDGVAAMLSHQIIFSQSLTPLYQSNMGVAEAEDGVNKRRQTYLTANATKAAEDYETAMNYCREELSPEIEQLDYTVIRPIVELREILKSINKSITKRHHKMIDYDRYRTNLTKLQTKSEKTINDEKQIFKLEGQLQTATQDYDYLNDMIKQQLPYFFQLRSHFIDPIFQAFYTLQVKIYLSMWQRIHELIEQNPDHFETLQYGIEDGFQSRMQNFNAREQLEQLDLLAQGGKQWKGATSTSSRMTLQEKAAMKKDHGSSFGSSPNSFGRTYSSGSNEAETQPPAYNTSNYQPQPPQMPMRRPSPSANYVTALYDYEAQTEGDLSFSAGDKIQVIERKAPNEWWTGVCNGVQGVFPGNYVENA
ncbi:hypothetical protein INT43_008579 [Umbelopsis isabellina]|uniref:BAR-domain-containing protein n=1 Tax=Mortierella isabellina TaxID=91625 RepID=A0A8H7UGP2_MORIS|nr:hypothetical protein INT43_008579 [Umbelopsis isabellina]